MFEGVIAGILNRFLGKYIQDLDTENLNVGIFSGNVNLTDLKLKPEALYELDLPIDVKVGTVGKISFQIPWSGLYTQPVIINIEDVLVLVGPAVSRTFYDPEREKRLMRAAKRKILQDIESDSETTLGPQNFFENLLTAIVNNIQIYIRNIHIRYEDSISSKDGSFACGLCLQSLSIETTNSKWKPSVTPQGSTSVYQMMKLESLSLYWNPTATVLDEQETRHITPMQFYSWKHYMLHGLEKFSMHREDFEFLLKPVASKVKVIINRSGEARVPRLLVDAVLQDSAMQISRRQYLSISNLLDSFKRISINRKYQHLHPKTEVLRNIRKWWRYAYNVVVEQRVRPYTWRAIKTHRDNYHRYKDVYKNMLRSPNDTELKLDLQKCEDSLPIVSIVIAREQAKIELLVEEPNRIEVIETEVDWWRPGSSLDDDDPEVQTNVELCSQAGKSKTLWSHLSSPEKQRISELIGYAEGSPKSDKPKQYIEHKLNLTLANWSLSLLNRGKEILVVTLTQFLASLETRPTAKAYKLSARAESILIEGASVENDLVPMLTADNVYTGNTASNFLAVDFEKNPLSIEADYGVNCTLEPVEIIYNEHTFTEIINFFQTQSMSMQDVVDKISQKMDDAAHIGKSVLAYAIDRRKVFSINMDLKGPYVVIPEYGTVQKGGNIMIVELGRISVKSELQPPNLALEDATCMELEERLYDRLHADCSALQVLFCDSGEPWRDFRKQADSDIHLIPKIRVQTVFSNSIKKDYKLLPRYKLNISISSIKLNLSDRLITLLLDFAENLPLPVPNTVPVSFIDSGDYHHVEEDQEMAAFLEYDTITPDPKFKQLVKIKQKLVRSYLSRTKVESCEFDKAGAKLGFLDGDKTFVSSEHSDEDMEIWARSVDLPGFDDNVSPNNYINTLLRFVIGEVVVNVSRWSGTTDSPCVMLRVGKLCVDAALMAYGPALQLALRSLTLVDKQHCSATGQYLEIVTTEGEEDIVNILYRKVRANCPDFKSHFHNVEQSLVADVGGLTLAINADVVRGLMKYFQELHLKIQNRISQVKHIVTPKANSLMDLINNSGTDPPIPPGATKFSYSFRLSQMKLKVTHLDCDLVEVKLAGLESDCVFKANDRMILKAFLNSLAVDDLTDITLYPKLLWVDDDKVFEMKYIRHSPRLYKKHSNSEALSSEEDVKSDGSLKVFLGRLHIVLLYKLIVDLQQFLEHLASTTGILESAQNMRRGAGVGTGGLRSTTSRIHLAVRLHAPTLLLPQKASSPNLIVFNMGDLLVENFFKEITGLQQQTRSDSSMENPVIDNILVKLVNITLSRAVMTLGGTLEVQEPILEPVAIRFDIKRALAYHHIVSMRSNNTGSFHRDVLLCEVDGLMDNIIINLGHRDLATILAVWSDNLMDGQYIALNVEHSSSPADSGPNTDNSVKKLQAFFAQGEPIKKEASMRFTLDGIELKLFTDMDEILSSPVRDLNHGLAKLSAGELTVHLDYYSDKSMDMKSNLQSLLLEDIRPDTTIVIKKMFQSHAGKMRVDSSISVSTPPIMDVTFRQNQAGDKNIDIHVEKTRLNFSVPFFIHLGRFVLEALPGDKTMEGGVVNHGYVGDLHPSKKDNTSNNNLRPVRPPSSADSTSGYCSIGTSLSEDSSGLSISVQFRKPEIMFFTDLSKSEGYALLVRTELLIDYSHHANRQNVIVSLAGLQVLSKLQSKLENIPPHLVLHPCDVEFAKSFRNVEEGIKVTVSVSAIDVHVAATTVHTLTDIVDEVMSELTVPEEKEQFNFATYGVTKTPDKNDNEELWSPKKLIPCTFLPQAEQQYSYTQPKYPTAVPTETFTMVIPSIRIMFEMERYSSRIPVLMVKSIVEVAVHNWSKQMYGKSEVNLQASSYNEKLDTWEPIIEPNVQDENVYRPWEFLVKFFQAKSYPMYSKLECNPHVTQVDSAKDRKQHSGPPKRKEMESETSADEYETTDNEMTFIRNPNGLDRKPESIDVVTCQSAYVFSTFTEDESDSENENRVMDKLASAIGHLFTDYDDSSENENSENEDSSGAEQSAVETDTNQDSAEPITYIDAIKTKSTKSTKLKNVEVSEKTVTLQDGLRSDSIDSGLETDSFVEKMATYVIFDARDMLNITVTPQAVTVLHNLLTSFIQKTIPVSNVAVHGYDKAINLVNDMGPGSTVHLVTRAETNLAGKDRVLAVADYDEGSSRPSTPGGDSSVAGMLDELGDESKDRMGDVENDWECFEGGFAIDVHTPVPTPLFSPTLSFPCDPVAQLYRKVTDERLIIKQHDFDELTVVCPQRTVNKIHVLQPSRNNVRYYIVVNRDSRYKNRKIVIRSPLQIRNETSYTMELYYVKNDLNAINVELMGELINPFEDKMRLSIIEPDETYNVPLYIAYHCRLFLLPSNFDGYQIASQGLWWPELAADLDMVRDITCAAKDGDDDKIFSMRILTAEGCLANKVTRAIPNYLIRILPPLAILNRLPYAVEISIAQLNYHIRIEAGERTYTYLLNLSNTYKVTLNIKYFGLPWVGAFNLSGDLQEKTITMTTDCETDGGNKELGICVKVDRNDSWALFLHAPYWIINKTGLPLQMKPSRCASIYDVSEWPLLYAAARRSGARGARMRVRAHHSAWSPAFAVSGVGAAGLVVCTHLERKRKYRMLLNVSLSELCPQLTRIVTLLPYFVIHNDTKRHLRYMEENEAADLWLDLAPGQCEPFWPDTDSMRLHCKYRESSLVSQHFPITANHFTVLRMDKGTAICVEVTGGIDTPFTVTFKPYQPGDAPVRIDNLCEDLFLKLNQKDLGQVALLSPNQSTLYTWDDPSKERTLLWNIYNNKGKGFLADFSRDGYGEEKASFRTVKHSTLTSANSVTSKLSSTLKRLQPKSPEPCTSSSDDSDSCETVETSGTNKKLRKDKVIVYWVSYLENYQRVFVLTQDERVAYQYRLRIDAEKSNYELYMSIAGISLSVCMQTPRGVKELSYISLTDSLPRWEVNISHKWKLLSPDLTTWIEEKFKSDQKKCQLKDYIDINFEKMQMTKPFFSELRRTYSPAIWCQMRKSDSHLYFHLKLHRLQIDNQLNESIFPSVLYPAPLPSHIAKKSAPKPCIELIVSKRHQATLNQDIYKCIKILVQEYCINLDRGFVNYVFDIMNHWTVQEKPAVRLRADMALIHMPLSSMATRNNSTRSVLLEYVHLSPVKLVLSLSSRGYTADYGSGEIKAFGNKKENRPKLFNSDLLEFVFNSWGSSLCDMKDVKLKMAYLELRNVHMGLSGLCEQARRHYSTQAIQQFYVLILGLDILGNPYSILNDFTRGLGDLYYEPYLGSGLGPEEMAFRLGYGVASLLGHCVCGFARAGSIFSNALGEYSAALSFDEEYKKKRRYGFYLQRSSDLPDMLIEASKTFVMGVALGLSGLIAKPTFDIYREATLLVRQCGGNTAAALRSALERAGGRLTARRRLPRHCHCYEGVRPYSYHEALGSQLLNALGRGQYADTDTYLAHATLGIHSKLTILLTTRRVFLVRVGSSHSWHVEWAVNLDDLIGVPNIQDNKLVLNVKQDELVNYFSTDEKVIESLEPTVLSWLQAKIESALILNMEDKHCPAQV